MRGRTRRAGQLALVVGLAVLPYLNALQDGFTFDDGPLILRNPVVHAIDCGLIFASPMFGYLYRPVTVLSYAINYAIAGEVAWTFHATNIALHAAVSALVFLLAEQLFSSAAIAVVAGVLFAVHPIHTEAVTSIVGRAEVLATFFGLLAILTAVRGEIVRRRGAQVLLRVASAMCFFFAVLSKESAATLLPLILFARMSIRGDSFCRGVWRELTVGDWVAYAMCLAAALGLRQAVVGGGSLSGGLSVPANRLDNVLAFVPPLERMRSAVAVIWDYFGLLHVPVVLSADYSYNQVPLVTAWLDPRWLAGAGLITALVTLMFLHPRPAVRFAAAVPLITLSLTANVFFLIGTIKAERLLYLPSVGWALLVAAAIAAGLRQARYRRVVGVACAVVVLAFGIRTWRRNADWRDDTALYLSLCQTAPESAKARSNCGHVFQQRGLDAAAVEQYRAALAIYPDTDQAALGMALALRRQGNFGEAIRWFDRSLAINPRSVLAHTYRCAAHIGAGNYVAAEAACRAGLRVEPTNSSLRKGLGFSLVGQADLERGNALLRRAQALDPWDAEIAAYFSRSQRESGPAPSGK
jgi:hypothetical protein